MYKLNCEDYNRLLCESLYSLRRYKNMVCEMKFTELGNNEIEFEGICGRTLKSLSKVPKKIFGIIKYDNDTITIEINNKYCEEYKIVQDYNTDQYYIINTLSKIVSYDGIYELEPEPISIRKGYFEELMYSCYPEDILKNYFFINWSYYDVKSLPIEDTYVMTAVNELRLKY